jgi:hypothetical protein
MCQAGVLSVHFGMSNILIYNAKTANNPDGTCLVEKNRKIVAMLLKILKKLLLAGGNEK